MDAINKFFESDACLYVIIGLLVILLVVFIVILVSSKLSRKKSSGSQSGEISDEIKAMRYNEDSDSEIKIVQTNSVLPDLPKESSVLPSTPVVPNTPVVPTASVLPETEVSKINEVSIIEDKKEVNNADLPLVNIPIPVIDDTPIEFTRELKVVEDTTTDTPIKVEVTEPVVESEPVQEELVKIDATIEIPIIKDASIAFNSNPTAEDQRNEEVVVEKPKEYKKEETEIFEFPDFTGLTGNDSEKVKLKDLKDGEKIEKEIIASTNSFIESIMSR